MEKFLKSFFGKKVEDDSKVAPAQHKEAELAQHQDTVPQKANSATGMDFSSVDSLEKAQTLYKEGKLFKLLLMPIEVGGPDTPLNTVYVPPGILEIQEKIIGTIIRFAEDDLIDNMAVSPEYKGNSFVPSKINIETTHSGKAGQFNPSIHIW